MAGGVWGSGKCKLLTMEEMCVKEGGNWNAKLGDIGDCEIDAKEDE